jgi:ribonuclease HI
MLKVMQKNLRKCKLATELAIQTFCNTDYDIGIYQEPYNLQKKLQNNTFYQCYKGNYYKPPPSNSNYNHEGYYVITLVKNYIIASELFKNDFILEVTVKAITGPINIANVYVPPTKNISMTLTHLQLSLSSNRYKHAVILGDFNARARLWGDIITSNRGDQLIDFIGCNKLTVLNEGNTPTYESSTGSSNIDVSLISTSLLRYKNIWKMLNIFDGSDHRTISLNIGIQPEERNTKAISYVSQETDLKLETFCKEWRAFSNTTPQSLEEYSTLLVNNVQETLVWKHKLVHKFKTYPWWNSKIRCVRNHCRALRRKYQSTLSLVNPSLRAEYRTLYLNKKKDLKKLIKDAKTRSWSRFIQENQEVWGKAYKVVFHEKYKDFSTLDSVNKPQLLDELFPFRTVSNWDTPWNSNKAERIPISITEIDNAIKFSSKGKAPGSDGLPALIWKKIHRINPYILHSWFNALFKLDYFPEVWKTAKIILIPKSGTGNNVSYRPISLLSTISKIYERVILRRLNFHTDPFLDKRQFGFKRGVGTTDALDRLFSHHRKIRGAINHPAKDQYACIFIDIKGAFNNFCPKYCLESLHLTGCPSNYINIIKCFLKNRTLELDDYKRNNENGSPQGSCLSPFLWNLIVEGFFRSVPDTSHTLLQAFADDIVIYIHHRDFERINEILFRNISISLNHWAISAGITFSIPKCYFLSSHENIRIAIQDQNITRTSKQKYLGVIINQKFTPKDHVLSIRDKCRSLTLKLSQIYQRNWGMSNINAKRIYLAAIEPIITYACSAWYDSTVIIDNKLFSAQRSPLMKICNTFRTVSTEALQILCGVLPIDLRIKELNAYRSFLKNDNFDIPKYSPFHPGITLIQKADQDPDYREENIFTDGSKSNQGSSAAMIHLNQYSIVKITRSHLGDYTTNFDCELRGILDAMLHMQQLSKVLPIYTDSLSAINSLTNDKPKSNTALKILDLAFKLKSIIQISWVKGHSGDYGNELADEEAKLATSEENIIYIKPSFKRLKKYLQAQSMNFWKTRWESSKNGRTLYQFIKEPKKSVLMTDFYINQFLTGHGYFPEYLQKFKLRNTKCICNSIPSQQANAAHYINDCPAFLYISREYFYNTSWSSKMKVFSNLAKKLEKKYSTKIHNTSTSDPG